MKLLVIMGLFLAQQTAFAQTMKGVLGLSTSGQDCGRIGKFHLYRAELVHKRVDDDLIVSPHVTKLTLELENDRTKVLADFQTDLEDVRPGSGGEEIIGEVTAIFSPLLAASVRYDTDGKGAGDEVRFTLVLDDSPSKVIVAGSRASRTRDCVISWIGKFGVREEQN